MNLLISTIQGIGWTSISRFLYLTIGFTITSILAHLLNPDDFGLLAMVLVFTNFAAIFKDLGLSTAIIQKKDLSDVELSSCFWLNILIGSFITLSLILFSPLIARFYNEKRLIPIIIAISTNFFISSLGSTHSALLTKKLNFKPLAIIDILTITIAGISAIILAIIGFGVWSLIFRQIILTSLTVLLLWHYSNWRPKFILNWKKSKKLFNFGLNLTGFSFINYFARNLDNLLIGKYWGATLLGYYNLAYELLLFPLSNIATVIGKVIFPSMSLVQEDKSKARSIYMNTTKYVSAISFPMMIGIFVCAPHLVNVFFGHQWERSIFLIQILSLVGFIQSIVTTIGWIYQSQGRPDIMLKWSVVTALVLGIAFFIGVKWNIEGMAIAYAIAAFILALPNFIIPFRLINLKFSIFIKQFKSTFLSAILMGFSIEIIRYFLLNYLKIGDLWILIALVISGIIIYGSLLYFMEKDLYIKSIDTLKLVLSKKE